MKDKSKGSVELSQQETRLIEQLRQRPEMLERVQSILDIASSADGPLKTADEVEGLLVEEMRRLGNTTMNQWAQGAEERVSSELKQADASVRSRKKKR